MDAASRTRDELVALVFHCTCTFEARIAAGEEHG